MRAELTERNALLGSTRLSMVKVAATNEQNVIGEQRSQDRCVSSVFVGNVGTIYLTIYTVHKYNDNKYIHVNGIVCFKFNSTFLYLYRQSRTEKLVVIKWNSLFCNFRNCDAELVRSTIPSASPRPLPSLHHPTWLHQLVGLIEV